jgi:hypothetical protein
MRIVRLADMPVIVRIRRRDEVTVVVPSTTPAYDVLAAAGLVLSHDEFAELEAEMGQTPDQIAPTHRYQH